MKLVPPYFDYRDFSEVPDPNPSAPLTAPGRLPNFPVKMLAILSRPDLSHIISWMPHGRSWRVWKPREFEVKVIPTYFEHSKFSSFIRQANGWGFRRITKGPDRNSYYHELFLRGLPHLTKLMQRPHPSQKPALNPSTEPQFYKISQEHPLPECKNDKSAEEAMAQGNLPPQRNNPPAKRAARPSKKSQAVQGYSHPVQVTGPFQNVAAPVPTARVAAIMGIPVRSQPQPEAQWYAGPSGQQEQQQQQHAQGARGHSPVPCITKVPSCSSFPDLGVFLRQASEAADARARSEGIPIGPSPSFHIPSNFSPARQQVVDDFAPISVEPNRLHLPEPSSSASGYDLSPNPVTYSPQNMLREEPKSVPPTDIWTTFTADNVPSAPAAATSTESDNHSLGPIDSLVSIDAFGFDMQPLEFDF